MNDTHQWIEIFTNAGFLYGPFFFSILFILVVTRIAHSYYKAINERVTPPATPEEKKTYRMFFLSSVTVGIVLVFIAVGWWIYAQMQKHVFEGVIPGVDANGAIITLEDNIYLGATERNFPGVTLRDYHFAIVQSNPFVTGQEFRLRYFPEGAIGEQEPEPIQLTIKYSGRKSEKFKLEPTGDTYCLTPINTG